MQALPRKPAGSRWGARGCVATALLAIGVMGGCYPKAGAAPGVLSAGGVAWASARWPSVTAASLSAGRDHFVSRCNGCHSLPDLAAIPEDRWPAIVESMARKAQLGAEDKDAVLHFILAARSERAGR